MGPIPGIGVGKKVAPRNLFFAEGRSASSPTRLPRRARAHSAASSWSSDGSSPSARVSSFRKIPHVCSFSRRGFPLGDALLSLFGGSLSSLTKGNGAGNPAQPIRPRWRRFLLCQERELFPKPRIRMRRRRSGKPRRIGPTGAGSDEWPPVAFSRPFVRSIWKRTGRGTAWRSWEILDYHPQWPSLEQRWRARGRSCSELSVRKAKAGAAVESITAPPGSSATFWPTMKVKPRQRLGWRCQWV